MSEQNNSGLDVRAFSLGHDFGFHNAKWFFLAFVTGVFLGAALTVAAIVMAMAWLRPVQHLI